MRFGMLGPVVIADRDATISPARAQRRGLLGFLMLNAGRAVTPQAIATALWGARPPATARKQIHSAIHAIRSDLRRVHADHLLLGGSTYCLAPEPSQLDLGLFTGHLSAGRAAAARGDHDHAVHELRQALGLWRGVALADAAGDYVAAARARLEDQRLTAVEELTGALLACGRHAAVIDEFGPLLDAQPLRERLHGHLTLALYRAGRREEALAGLRRLRAGLADALGIDPPRSIEDLEVAMLRADPGLQWRPVGPPAVRMLPPEVRDFVGRRQQEAEVGEAVNRTLAGTGPAAVLLRGQPGVGKTTLAIRCAHRAAAPGGRLYLNLRGFHESGDPVDPADGLSFFLRALGLEGSAIPDALEQRAALFRSRSAGKGLLILLDDARSSAQVRPLLPGPGCATIITSRVDLPALDVHRIALHPLDDDEATELFLRAAGLSATPDEAARRISRLCGNLPLALRIAGARLAAHPHWSPASLAGLLEDERHRLDQLAVADLDVRAALHLSLRQLDPATHGALCLVSLLDCTTFPSWVVAAMVGGDRAGPAVDTLVGAGLLIHHGPDPGGEHHFRLHDLVRLFAREQAETHFAEEARVSAVARAIEAWRKRIAVAEANLQAAPWLPADPLPPPPAAPVEGLPTALRWLESQCANAVSAVEQAAALGLSTAAWSIADRMLGVFILQSRLDQWHRAAAAALGSALRCGDLTGQAWSRLSLGLLELRRDHLDEAEAHLRASGEVFTGLGDNRGRALAELILAECRRWAGADEEAMRLVTRVLAEPGMQLDHLAVLRARLLAAILHRNRGEHVAAQRLAAAGAALATGAGALRPAAQHHHLLGSMLAAKGRNEPALRELRTAIELFNRVGDEARAAYSQMKLGTVLLAESRHREATETLAGCLADFERLGDRYGAARASTAFGEARLVCGQTAAAVELLHSAHDRWLLLGPSSGAEAEACQQILAQAQARLRG